MRNAMPLLSRPPVVATPSQPANTQAIPSIRLISATPSATGMSTEASTSVNYSVDSSWASIPSPLAPKQDNPPTRKRLVLKKSKLSLLGVGRDKEKDRANDFSDVVRRVGGSSASVRGGFEIYVDPTVDPDIGEIVMVKKKKSRVALDGMKWGALGEVTNVPQVAPKEAPATLKVKAEEKDKWWSIGRGRKDSKEKTKEAKENKTRAKSPEPVSDPPKSIRGALPRSKTPEPLKFSGESRARFNSLDSGILLNTPINMGPTPLTAPIADPPSQFAYPRSSTPTAGGLLAPPASAGTNQSANQGSIALRAMRSVRSLAHMSSWAQLKNTGTMSTEEKDLGPAKKDGTLSGKKVKEVKKKKKEKEGESAEVEKGEEKKKKKKVKKVKEDAKEVKEVIGVREVKEKPATVRMSSSSFEAGALTSSPVVSKSLGKKKHSILGLGLPSSMRLPTVRSGSTASSVLPPVSNNRLSVESAAKMGRDRAASTVSTGSSLRPMSTASSTSRASSNSSVSVKWDEEGLETVKEQRRKERESRRRERKEEDAAKGKDGKESRRSSEGRRRTPLSEVFPQVQPLFKEQPLHPVPLESPASVKQYPMLMIEEATSDGHGSPEDDAICEEGVKEAPAATPVKKARARPLSEQLLGRSRPKPMYEDEDGVLSILSAATNDLAQLINNLDLEATPATPDMTPLRPSLLSEEKLPGSHEYDGSPTKSKKGMLSGSPLKKTLRDSTASITSLRPYAQSRGPLKSSSSRADLIGQPITSWPTLVNNLSPLKESPPPRLPLPPPPDTTPTTRAFRPTHKRTMTPAPEPDPEPVFHPLPAARPRGPTATLKVNASPMSINTPNMDGTIRAPSSLTFGSRSSSRAGSRGSMDDFCGGGSPTPGSVFKRAKGHERKRSSLVPISAKSSRGSQGSIGDGGVPIPPEARRVLGMAGTMGGSDVSGYAVPELDMSDPDSDVPDELRFILSANSDKGSADETLSYREDSMEVPSSPDSPMQMELPLPGSSDAPPKLELPIFRAALIDVDENHADIDEGGITSEEDTKKSFDFTGELKKLNESGGSDRRSFVEQLENAFRTPAKVDLRYLKDGLLCVEVPPVPQLPVDLTAAMETEGSSEGSSAFDSYSASQIVDMKEPAMMNTLKTEDDSKSKSDFDLYSASRIVDMKEPTLLPGSDSLASSSETHDIVMHEPSSLRTSASSGSRPSDGQLNTSFKFGGLPSPSPSRSSNEPKKENSLTLSDIIPPPSHIRSLSMSSAMDEDDSILKSIFAKVADLPEARRRVNSDSSSKRYAREVNRKSYYRHSRHSSGLSFAGLESFDEVRRGFEFSSERPAFYPPPGATRRTNHRNHDSVFSIASVSSYGRVIDSGSMDPFDFGLPSLQERPSSENMSIAMSMSVDDTFSFLGRQPRRTRVDSDASSFYFRAPLPQTGFTRGHRRHESSNMSISSQAPPISLYNRSFSAHAHRRNDSFTSASSVAQSYAMHGASGGRAAWARHRQDSSLDSVMSDFSGMHLGRPGIGDKMFETDHGMALTSISASPPESLAASRYGNGNRSSFDSILDGDRRSSMNDSLFDKTGHRSSMSSDSVFGDDYAVPGHPGLLLPGQFRPLSIISMNSEHSPMREDDTMISMLGGGHVRRRSVGSIIETSPCVRVEKRKHSMFDPVKNRDEYYESPNKARIVEKPSIASTSSYQFGGERMIKAQRGLLERQSLEDSCLIAEGEDITNSFRTVAVFSRPGPASRSRSSTCTSSSGGDTPPLSASDGSSMSEGSLSSIDISQLNTILTNATHPMSSMARNRARTRARGQGHRRRFSKAHASRSSVYETIEEEMSNGPSPAKSLASKKSSPTTCQPIFIVDSDTASLHNSPSETIWNDERGIIALRKYYALRDEAENTVTESKQQWRDTPFSMFALQSFQPPRHPAGIQALLEHSVQNYGPLPSELRPRRIRSRTQSRPSPYPQARIAKVTTSPEQVRMSTTDVPQHFVAAVPVLQQVPINANVPSVAPFLCTLKPFSPLVMDVEPKRENAFGLAPSARPRVGSTARRTALGWSKRSSGKSSTDQKENALGQGAIVTPGESLRINRPRPRGRPTPARPTQASQNRPIRV